MPVLRQHWNLPKRSCWSRNTSECCQQESSSCQHKHLASLSLVHVHLTPSVGCHATLLHPPSPHQVRSSACDGSPDPTLAHLLPPPPPACALPFNPCPFCRSVWDDYEADTELIGRGAFARVFRALKRDDGSHVAIKVIGRETKAFPQQRRGEQQQRRLRRSHLHPTVLQQCREDAAGSSARQHAAARSHLASDG